MKKLCFFLGLVSLLALLSVPAEAQLVDNIVDDYQRGASSWLQRMLPIAQKTFAILATLELVISGLLWASRRDSLDQVLMAFLKKFILLSFLFSLITLFPIWIPYITRSFVYAGQHATGIDTMSPSGVLDVGILLSTKILLSLSNLGISQLAGRAMGVITSLLVLIAYIGIAAQLVLVLVESYIVLTGGILFLGFAGFRGTVSFAEGYIVYAFNVGIKIFLLYLIVGVGMSLSGEWVAIIDRATTASGYTFSAFFQVMGGAWILTLLVWRIPGGVANQLTQGSSFRLADALRG